MQAFLSRLVLDPSLRALRFRCAIAMYIAILILGSVPGARAEIGHFANGVVLHSIAYGAMAFLIYTGTNGERKQRALKAVLGVVAMGALDELVQSFLPYRVGAVSDWLVDINAAVITTALLWFFLPEPRKTN